MSLEWNFTGPRLTVTLCVVESWNLQVTVVPARTESDAGENAKSSTLTVRLAAAFEVAGRATAAAAATASSETGVRRGMHL
jgi:hypothetical protein